MCFRCCKICGFVFVFFGAGDCDGAGVFVVVLKCIVLSVYIAVILAGCVCGLECWWSWSCNCVGDL